MIVKLAGFTAGWPNSIDSWIDACLGRIQKSQNRAKIKPTGSEVAVLDITGQCWLHAESSLMEETNVATLTEIKCYVFQKVVELK